MKGRCGEDAEVTGKGGNLRQSQDPRISTSSFLILHLSAGPEGFHYAQDVDTTILAAGDDDQAYKNVAPFPES